MILEIILLVVGIALVLWGADKFTDGASSLARKWHVSELIIGLTVVAMGTSLPELMVSLFSSIKGSGDMSVGNIIGSNIFNTLIIIGAAGVMMTLPVSRKVLLRDIPLTLFSAMILFLLCIGDSELGRIDGLILISIFIVYMLYIFTTARKNKEEAPSAVQTLSIPKIILFLLLGVGCLIGGGEILVDNAEALALRLGVSERIVGLTILAAGTSFPELATSIVAARKGSDGLALGNALGSNIFNIFFVLGLCSTVKPIQIIGISYLDWTVLILSGVLLFVMSITKRKIEVWEGVILILFYLVYLTMLILNFSF